jgi:hypothetical protein
VVRNDPATGGALRSAGGAELDDATVVAQARPEGGPERVCWARMLRSEVEVLTWSPDRGNPTSKRQGRGPELTGRPQCGLGMRCGVSVRAGLKEAIDALWWRTKVKRRKAFLGGRADTQRRCPIPVDTEGVVATRSRRNLSVSPQEICWVPARVAGRPKNERTTTRWPSRSPRTE